MRSDIRIVLVISLVIVVMSMFGGLAYVNSHEHAASELRAPCTRIDYGNGVYYFPCTGDEFGKSLAHFKEVYPTIAVDAMASESYRAGSSGYFVSTHVVSK